MRLMKVVSKGKHSKKQLFPYTQYIVLMMCSNIFVCVFMFICKQRELEWVPEGKIETKGSRTIWYPSFHFSPQLRNLRRIFRWWYPCCFNIQKFHPYTFLLYLSLLTAIIYAHSSTTANMCLFYIENCQKKMLLLPFTPLFYFPSEFRCAMLLCSVALRYSADVFVGNSCIVILSMAIYSLSVFSFLTSLIVRIFFLPPRIWK